MLQSAFSLKLFQMHKYHIVFFNVELQKEEKEAEYSAEGHDCSKYKTYQEYGGGVGLVVA